MARPGCCEVCDNLNAAGETECAWCEATLPRPIPRPVPAPRASEPFVLPRLPVRPPPDLDRPIRAAAYFGLLLVLAVVAIGLVLAARGRTPEPASSGMCAPVAADPCAADPPAQAFARGLGG